MLYQDFLLSCPIYYVLTLLIRMVTPQYALEVFSPQEDHRTDDHKQGKQLKDTKIQEEAQSKMWVA